MIRADSYEKLAQHLMEVCSHKELLDFLAGDTSVVHQVIVDELLLNDFQGVFLDIIFEDLFSQKKKPILKVELEKFGEFLMSDVSLILLQYNLSKKMKYKV